MVRGCGVLSVDVQASTGGSEREVLRAVLAFHRKTREAQHRTPIPRERTLDDVNELFECQPSGRSTRDRIVAIAVREGANVYVTEHSSVDQLRIALDKGLPVIVGTQSTSGTSFAVVVAIDETGVSVISPRGGRVELVSKQAFGQLWHCLDEGVDHEQWCAILNFDNRELAGVFRQGRDLTPPDRRRKGYILCAAWSIFFAELALSYFAYADPRGLVSPMLALALAMLGFPLIDFFARPEKREYTSTLASRWYRPFLPFWCLVPFVTAVGGSIWVHYRSGTRRAPTCVSSPARSRPRWSGRMTTSPTPRTRSAKPGDRLRQPASPRDPDFDDDDDDPIADVVDARHWYAVDEATDHCWRTAHEHNVAETRRVRSSAAIIDGTNNPFSAFAAVGLPEDNRKAMARQFATNRTWRCFTTERVNCEGRCDRRARVTTARHRPAMKRSGSSRSHGWSAMTS